MKALVKLIVMVAAVSLLIPMSSYADIMGTAELDISWSGEYGRASFDGGATYQTYYLDYDAAFTGTDDSFEAYCVESSDAPHETTFYTLLSIDDTLESFGLDAEAYKTAAWIADNYYNRDSQDKWKSISQVAIWEVIFDFGSYDLGGGSFRSTYSRNAEVETILTELGAQTIGDSTSWHLAVNPEVTAGQPVSVAAAQNYLIPVAPVPEPATLALFGFGLIGVAGFIRKRGINNK